MKCIYCATGRTDVVNSRETNEGMMVWRRRSCRECGRLCTTRETARGDNLFVIKRNGKRQRFVYEKLFVSIFSVLHTQKHRDNGDNALLAKRLAEQVLEDITWNVDASGNVATSDLIAFVARRLRAENAAFADRYLQYSPYREQVAKERRLQHAAKIADEKTSRK